MLLHNEKWYNPSQTEMKEKIDLLLKEFQEVKLRSDKLKNNLKRKPKIIVGLVGR